MLRRLSATAANIEEGIRLGVRLVDTDKALFGDSGNLKAFVAVSEGQSPVIRAALDRRSRLAIAVAGDGEYFEIGDEPDRVVAFRIIDRLRRRATTAEQVETFDELYPRFLLAAAFLLGLATIGLRRPTELVWQAAGAGAAVLLLATLL